MSTPVSLQKRASVLRRLGLVAVVLIPLAFAGLFVGALAQSDSALDRIPAAVVNNDKMITTTDADGNDQIVFAGRQLVTELTGADGFDWTITNEEDAQALLDSGKVYAVLTVPSDFSKSILSISGDNPTKADISIATDDSHSYLTGSVAQVVGQTMTDTFGREITKQYLAGLYDGMGQLGSALSEAADGADGLADGATSLQGGATSLQDGAYSLSSGLSDYTAGVSGVASGLNAMSEQTAELGQLSTGVSSYTGFVTDLSKGLSALAPAMTAPTPELQDTFDGLIANLAATAEGGPALAQGASGLPGLQSGISQLASGSGQLAASSDSLVSGVDQLAGGAGELASGAGQLASGASQLATGLQEGADQVPATDPDTAAATADVVVEPVGVNVTTANAVTDVGQGVATFFVPLGLWIGALAVFLVLKPVSRRALASTARNGRLVAASIGRAGVVTALQALLLVGLLHGALGVAWSLLPATLLFSIITALAFTAFHYLLTIGLGRGGLVVSLFALAIQVTSTGGIYPVELLSTPFQVISPFLPLTWAVSGMQGIIAGGAAGTVVSSALILLAFGVGSVILALFAIRRTRRADVLGLVPLPA